MSKPIKFYYDLMSQPARALFMFLKLTKIPFEGQLISIQKGEHLTDDYRRNINRFGKLPCIDDNGFLLAETPAIMQYLVRKFPHLVADHWYPSDAKARARVDEFMSWQHMNLRLHLSAHFWGTFILPRLFGKSLGEERLNGIREDMEKTLNFVEKVYLKGDGFIAGGDKISFADLLALGELKQLTMTDCDPTEGRPNIKRYIERVIKEVQPQYDEAYVVINKVAKAVQSRAKL